MQSKTKKSEAREEGHISVAELFAATAEWNGKNAAAIREKGKGAGDGAEAGGVSAAADIGGAGAGAGAGA